MLALALPLSCRAGKLLEREAAEVFAKISVAAGQLSSMSGELDIKYASADAFRKDHTARFWFSKPFRLRVDQLPAGGIELYCVEGRATLYLPDRKQVVEFELGQSDGLDVLPRFFSLFTIPGFVRGALLTDVESQFATSIEEIPRGWRVTLTPTVTSFYRTALGLALVTADVDRATTLPYRLELHEELVSGTRAFCTIELARLAFNPQVAPHLFLYLPRPGVRRVPATEVLKEWVVDALARASGQGHDVFQSFEKTITNLRKNPWDF